MSFEKMWEQLMFENSKDALEKIFSSMFETIKSMGDTTLTTLFPSASPEMRQQILHAAWKDALFKACLNASCKDTITHKISREEWFSDDGKIGTVHPPQNKPRQFPMTKEEFLSLTEEELESVPPVDIEPFSYDVGEYTHRERAEQSVLNKYGYSVSKESYLSSKQRQELLAHLISTHKVSKSYVISLLEHLIKINGKKETNDIAVTKWKADLDFVRKIN